MAIIDGPTNHISEISEDTSEYSIASYKKLDKIHLEVYPRKNSISTNFIRFQVYNSTLGIVGGTRYFLVPDKFTLAVTMSSIPPGVDGGIKSTASSFGTGFKLSTPALEGVSGLMILLSNDNNGAFFSFS